MSEWHTYKLKDITTKIGSGSTPTGGSGAYKAEGISLIRSQNVLDYKFTEDGLAFIDDDQAYALRNVIVEANDVLLNITGDSVARCCGAPANWLPARVNQHVAILRSDTDKLDHRFLKYSLLASKEELLILSEIGGTRNALTKGMLEDYEISIPPLPEQKAIASVLSSLDDKIDLLHRQNKTLEAMAETLFRQWFIEEAKEDWEDCILGDILEVLESGSRPKGGIDPELKSGIPSLGAESINGICKFDYSKVKYVTLEFADSCKKGHAQPWDVLIYKDGAYVGKKALFGEKFPYPRFMINEHVFRLRSNTRCSQLYLYFALDSESLALLNSNSAQPGINQQSLKSYQITLPPKEKMEAFDSVVRPLTIKMNENAIQISTCEKLRDTLLPKLMSGEVRVQYQTEEVA
ncbi:restriction endonuclease subunit S [Acinetobacter faecalis]|uniref:restriction endonuclease subunit S n=1 Tax=Acinetobacter faecalis TaxID=2665161 RepID=UPI002A9129D1|nr:restriction endonuclease subunit S [Acinetobacter faecalis]MDY6485354.1 restriction endonuclease subunit S [Acinetobacter faecalis]